MAESRLKSNIRRQAIHNITLVVGGFIVLIVLLVVFGSTLLTNFSLLVEKSNGNNDTNSANAQSDVFVAPPTLNTVAIATNKPQVDVSGFAQKNQTVTLYVNNQIVDKTDVGDNNQFHFPSVQLQSGQNSIKVKAASGNKQSDFSNTDTISYLKNPPNLTISSPQDGQGFDKNTSSSVSINGTTDPGAKITVNGSWAIVDDTGKFSYLYTLKDGDNDIKVISTDNAGNQTTKEFHIHTQ